MLKNKLKERIREIAVKELIDEVRFIDADDLTEDYVGNVSQFKGRQPQDIMKGAKSVILTSVYIGKFVTDTNQDFGRMSRLVLSGYYANIVKPLHPIIELLKSEGYRAEIMDGESDDKTIPLKGAAVKAGLGWIGKNSMLISKKYGSFQALGAIITDADIGEYNEISKNFCGGCDKCIQVCPANAIETPQILTRPKCLSDMFENENVSKDEINSIKLDNYFFECDICQNACTWNQAHIRAPLDTPYGRLYNPSDMNKLVSMEWLSVLDEATYNEKLLPIMIGYQLPFDLFKRNISVIVNQSRK
ncbi:epoxyqueuosine reductase [Anaerovorax sp. IOR16]|uniref:epoxyqueuosine reductase n=1 Tax=Anaerovorax sp. IOR16 TaxID=2773458 RepID=UPI0019CFD372|nr:4Fe-4S double cluster binding domain-containing protein [Anaerovorax sp. IOR16]